MDLMVCDQCNHVDAIELAYPNGPLDHGRPREHWVCTMCQIGVWHDKFEYVKFRPGFDHVQNRPNGLSF